MLLAIDIGNTNTVLGVFDGEKLVHSWRIKTDARSTADELALTFRGLLADLEITGVSACSTVPAAMRELRTMLGRYYEHAEIVLVEPGGRRGIVVDFGTSTNFDVISARGDFVGGALAPGIEISVDALAARAAQLRKVELVVPRSPIGKNTVEALQSGILYGFGGQVGGLVRRIIVALTQTDAGNTADIEVIATGGLAPLLIEHCETVTRHEPDLTLIGLRLIY